MTQINDLVRDEMQYKEKERLINKMFLHFVTHKEIEAEVTNSGLFPENSQILVLGECFAIARQTGIHKQKQNESKNTSTENLTDRLRILYGVLTDEYQLPASIAGTIPSTFFPKGDYASTKVQLVRTGLGELKKNGIVDHLPNRGWRRI